jgi:uncharacterized protein YkuJ
MMEDTMNKKGYLLLSFIFCITLLSFTACGKKVMEKSSASNIEEKSSTSNIAVSMKDEMFELRMYVDKDTYTHDEVINCYATLEYIGDKDSIMVYSADPLVGFALKDDKYFDGEYATQDQLITTTIKKGEIVRFDYAKSGGWTGEDPNADFYQKFYSEKELILPAGKYEISATIACSLDVNDMLGSEYKKSVSAYVTVTN